MSYQSSRRLAAVQSPVIPIVGKLIKDHPGTISLGQGVVYYGPPESCKTAIAQFWDASDKHIYGSVNGHPLLRELIWQKLQKDNGLGTKSGRSLMITAGGNMAFSHAISAITDPGDQVILLSPFYFNHEMAIDIAGAKPKVVPTDSDFQPDIPRIIKAINSKTRAIVTVSPNNPTGVVYSDDCLKTINSLCKEYGLYHIHDEAYEYFHFGTSKQSSPLSFDEGEEHSICLYSLSKSYGFASWRIGYMVFPDHLYEAVRKIQDTHLICPSLIAQYAATAALKTGKPYITSHLPVIQKARDIFLSGLEEISDICYVPPSDGAFYFLLRLDTKMDAMDVVTRLISEHKVAAIPGDTFGITKGCYIRIAYGSVQEAQAKVGIQRLVKGLQTIIA